MKKMFLILFVLVQTVQPETRQYECLDKIKFVKQFKLKNMSTKTYTQTISGTTVKSICDNQEVLPK
jgi:hypothetical protein